MIIIKTNTKFYLFSRITLSFHDNLSGPAESSVALKKFSPQRGKGLESGPCGPPPHCPPKKWHHVTDSSEGCGIGRDSDWRLLLLFCLRSKSGGSTAASLDLECQT
jgi:hypothetical protein